MTSWTERRVALVTGGNGGIGRAVCRSLAADGFSIVVNHLVDREEAAAFCASLAEAHPRGEFIPVQADVSDPDQVAALVEVVGARWGRLDLLVNAAGINRDRTLRKIDPAEWLRVLEVNLHGTFHTCRACLPLMGAGGRIVQIASVLAVLGNFGQTNYAASKSGLIGFTRSLAQELAGLGITVNAVAPGFIDTPMTAGMPPAARARWLERIPMGRFGRPEEVAACVRFLASPEASYITGSILHVNGGLF